MKLKPLRCGVCGRFVAYKDFDKGKIISRTKWADYYEQGEVILFVHKDCEGLNYKKKGE